VHGPAMAALAHNGRHRVGLGAGAHGELGDGTTPEDVTTAVKVGFPAGVKITPCRIPCRSTPAWPSTPRATWGQGRRAVHRTPYVHANVCVC
jgi:hypothetical protein